MMDASQNLDACRRTPEYAAAFEPMDLAEAWVLPEQPKPPGHRGPGAADTESLGQVRQIGQKHALVSRFGLAAGVSVGHPLRVVRWVAHRCTSRRDNLWLMWLTCSLGLLGRRGRGDRRSAGGGRSMIGCSRKFPAGADQTAGPSFLVRTALPVSMQVSGVWWVRDYDRAPSGHGLRARGMGGAATVRGRYAAS